MLAVSIIQNHLRVIPDGWMFVYHQPTAKWTRSVAKDACAGAVCACAFLVMAAQATTSQCVGLMVCSTPASANCTAPPASPTSTSRWITPAAASPHVSQSVQFQFLLKMVSMGLGKAHTRSAPSLNSVPKVALKNSASVCLVEHRSFPTSEG